MGSAAAVKMVGALLLLVLGSSSAAFPNLQPVYSWEFGEDEPSSFLAYQKRGLILPSMKHLDVSIRMQFPCLKLVYVQVKVHNHFNIPSVTYNTATKTVSIAYGISQHSLSSYKVIGKAIRFCADSNSLEDDQQSPTYPNYPSTDDISGHFGNQHDYPDRNLPLSSYSDSGYPDREHSETQQSIIDYSGLHKYLEHHHPRATYSDPDGYSRPDPNYSIPLYPGPHYEYLGPQYSDPDGYSWPVLKYSDRYTPSCLNADYLRPRLDHSDQQVTLLSHRLDNMHVKNPLSNLHQRPGFFSSGHSHDFHKNADYSDHLHLLPGIIHKDSQSVSSEQDDYESLLHQNHPHSHHHHHHNYPSEHPDA